MEKKSSENYDENGPLESYTRCSIHHLLPGMEYT